MNRKQKIELLKGIAKGSHSISELAPTTYDLWMCLDNETYFNPKTGASITKAEHQQQSGKEKNIFVTLNIE